MVGGLQSSLCKATNISFELIIGIMAMQQHVVAKEKQVMVRANCHVMIHFRRGSFAQTKVNRYVNSACAVHALFIAKRCTLLWYSSPRQLPVSLPPITRPSECSYTHPQLSM
jgi:hypothetical protein